MTSQTKIPPIHHLFAKKLYINSLPLLRHFHDIYDILVLYLIF